MSSLRQKLLIVPWMRQQDPSAQSSLSVSLSEVEGFHATLFTAVLFSPFWKGGSWLWFFFLPSLPLYGFNLGYFNPAEKSKCVSRLLSVWAAKLISLFLFVIKCSEWTIGVSLRDRESESKNLNGEAHSPHYHKKGERGVCVCVWGGRKEFSFFSVSLVEGWSWSPYRFTNRRTEMINI